MPVHIGGTLPGRKMGPHEVVGRPLLGLVKPTIPQ